jgi:2'-5' RNA ligase
MDTTMLPVTGYKINEYMLVLQPHEELWNRIYKLRKSFAEKYRLPVPKAIRQHLTIAHFVTWAMREDKLVQRLQAITMSIAPFRIELKDYGSLPTHSIFIQITSKLPLKNLAKQLSMARDLIKLDQVHKPHFIEEPHFLVASRLRPWQYEQGWLDFSHRHFTGRFIADGILLLRRVAGESSSFQILKRFEFMNLPTIAKQATFFA